MPSWVRSTPGKQHAVRGALRDGEAPVAGVPGGQHAGGRLRSGDPQLLGAHGGQEDLQRLQGHLPRLRLQVPRRCCFPGTDGLAPQSHAIDGWRWRCLYCVVPYLTEVSNGVSAEWVAVRGLMKLQLCLQAGGGMGSSARTSMSARRELRSANTPAPTLPAAMSAAAGMASSWWDPCSHTRV